MPRDRDPVKWRQWAARIKRQASSGLTVAEFCRVEGVAPPSFYQWKARLARPLGPGAAAATRHRQTTARRRETTAKAGTAPGFQILQVIAEGSPTAKGPAASVTIRLPGGAVIELGENLAAIQLVLDRLLDAGMRHGACASDRESEVGVASEAGSC